jgi:hypothetical protein
LDFVVFLLVPFIWLAARFGSAACVRAIRWSDPTGLRYDDLYDPYFDLDIKEALGRLPREVVDARIQRLKRAMDLSMKHQYLPEDLQVRAPSFPRSGSLSS